MTSIGVIVDNELNNDIRVLREISIMREAGFEVNVLCLGFGKTYDDSVHDFGVTRLSLHRKIKDIMFFMLNTIPVYEWYWASHIAKFIQKNKPGYLHVHDLYMSRATWKGIKASRINIGMTLDLHENYPYTVTTYNWTKGFLRKMISQPGKWIKKEKEYLSYATKIIVLSQGFRDLLLTRYSSLEQSDFTVLPNVPDLSLSENIRTHEFDQPFRNGFPVLFYYGVIAERRGIFDALDVFSSLVKEGKKLNFLLIGPVDKKDRERFDCMIKTDTVKDSIVYIPWIESKDFYSYLQFADICLAPFHRNPQHESGVANKIYDYMLGAKPIVASDCKPQMELILRHDCGFIFSTRDQFHDAIVKLLNDKSLRERLGENGKRAVLENYNTDIIKNNLISLYKG